MSAIDSLTGNNNGKDKKSDYYGMITEITAKKILFGPEDDYKKGHNDAMDKALTTVRNYEKGEGLFQQAKQSENDLWEQAAQELFFAHRVEMVEFKIQVEEGGSNLKLIKLLCDNGYWFHSQPVPAPLEEGKEAIEFAEWIEKEIYTKGLNSKWYKIPGVTVGEKSQYTIYELYKIFKTK